MDNRFLTLEETAEFLNLPLHYVYRISAENRLPGKIRFGQRTVRVDKGKLVEWLEQQAGSGKQEQVRP